MARCLWTEYDCVKKIGLSLSKEIIPVREDPQWSRWKSVTDAAWRSIPIVDRLFRSSKQELYESFFFF